MAAIRRKVRICRSLTNTGCSGRSAVSSPLSPGHRRLGPPARLGYAARLPVRGLFRRGAGGGRGTLGAERTTRTRAHAVADGDVDWRIPEGAYLVARRVSSQ